MELSAPASTTDPGPRTSDPDPGQSPGAAAGPPRPE